MTQKVDIHPSQGVIIGTPYVNKSSTFKSVKEEAGYAQLSEVIAVGSSFIDDHGNLREPTCKCGDIILHSYVQDDREIDFQNYRFIKFFQVLGVYKYATN